MKSRIKVHSENTCFGDLGTPQFVDVLFPDDFQAIRTRQQDIQFRLLAELNNSVSSDCSYHFVTLTYDDNHLPQVVQCNTFHKLSDPDDEGNCQVLDEVILEKVINVALTRDLQTFNKRLRINIKRHLPEDTQFKYKYLLCHEYGRSDDYLDEFGRLRTATERAHYHGIFKCSPAVSEDLFQSLVDQSWGKGRTLNPKLEGDDLYQAIGYTSKYVSKQLSLTSAKFRPSYEDYTLVKSEYYSLPDEHGYIRDVELNEINPRVLTSKNLGACYVHENNDESQPLRSDLFVKGQHKLQLNTDNESINIPLPRYYFQKYCKHNAYYVPLYPDTFDVDLVEVIEKRDFVLKSGSLHTKKNYYYLFSDGSTHLVKTKSISSDTNFYLQFKSIIAENNAIRKTQDFLDYFYSVPSFKDIFKPDFYRIKEYFRNRFSLMPVIEYRPHVLPQASKYKFYGMYGTASLPMPLPVQRYALLADIDPYYYQLEILINAYEKTQESRRCARNAVRSYQARKRRQESHDKKLHRANWRKSVV